MTLAAGLIDAIDNLDPLPVTAQRLVGILGNAEVPIQDVVSIVENDPAVTANLLRMANSPLYGGRFRIDRIRDAVVRLGATTLLDIALGGYLKKLSTGSPLYDLSEDDLWLHSAVASLAVQEIHKESTETVPSNAGIAALVHDIGKLIMGRYQKASSAVVVAHCAEHGISFIEGERQLFHCDHAEVGSAIARRWNFPEPVIEAIERHHDYPLEHSSLSLDAVVTANFVAKTIGVGLGAEGMNLRIDQTCLRRLGIDFEKFCRVCARTATRMEDLKTAYGLS